MSHSSDDCESNKSSNLSDSSEDNSESSEAQIDASRIWRDPAGNAVYSR
jgi:hypothetical protein